jgi:hypothetical protein
MITSTYLLEYVGIVASVVLGVATAVCGILLLVKTAGHLSSDSLRRVSPKLPATIRRTKRPDTYAEICRAVLEAQASEPMTPPCPAADDALPVFARAAQPTELPDATRTVAA